MTVLRNSALFLLLLLAAGCTDDSGTEPTPGGTTEAQLYSLGKNAAGFTFYKNSADTITKGGNSAHPDPQLRTRYNSVAARFLGSDGKVKAGTLFPDSSLIVKELYTNSVLTTYVFMFKRAGDPHADANGWVWAETHADGSTLYAASKKGAGCTGCHSTGIDFTRMNDAHP
ncbi:MAG: cytochrome P460 family protein [Bacteroidetes bacterium]|nr:MAG: cytochrome P460 family protein [Bacteroidota bacterium]